MNKDNSHPNIDKYSTINNHASQINTDLKQVNEQQNLQDGLKY